MNADAAMTAAAADNVAATGYLAEMETKVSARDGERGRNILMTYPSEHRLFPCQQSARMVNLHLGDGTHCDPHMERNRPGWDMFLTDRSASWNRAARLASAEL
jgi:hypothetical protein